jgi:hypothetical protein
MDGWRLHTLFGRQNSENKVCMTGLLFCWPVMPQSNSPSLLGESALSEHVTSVS